MNIVKLIILCIGVPVWWCMLGMAVLSFSKQSKERGGRGLLNVAILAGAEISVLLCLISVYVALRIQADFTFLYKVYGMIMFCVTIVSVLLLAVRKKGREFVQKQIGCLKENGNIRMVLLLGLLYLSVAGTFFLHRPFLEERYDLPERLATMAQSNALAGINPLTGMSQMTGPLLEMWKDAGIPAFYLWFMRACRLSLFDVLFKVVPLWVLCLCMCAYLEIAAALFGRENKRGIMLFMLAFVLFTLCGNQAYMNPSYELLHYAYEETTLVSSVLLPTVFALMLQIGKKRISKSKEEE